MNAGVLGVGELASPPPVSESGLCAAELHSARSVSNTMIATTFVSERYSRIVESRQLRAQLQPYGLPSPWPGALHRAPPVKECVEPRSL